MITDLDSAEIVERLNREILGETQGMLPSVPSLVVLEGIGDNPLQGEVSSYVSGKLKAAEDLGIQAVHWTIEVPQIPEVIKVLNHDVDVDAVLVESPLPGLSKEEEADFLDELDGVKAVDNQGKSARWGMGATPEAVVTLLDHHGHTGKDQNVLIIGNGRVGGPLVDVYGDSARKVKALEVVNDKNRHRLPKLARAAGMVIVATGHPNTLTPDMVSEGQVIAAVGASDVHPDVREITDRRFSLTPKKGGVGPATIRKLLKRSVHLAQGNEPYVPFASERAA